jgi:hypothetical protein
MHIPLGKVKIICAWVSVSGCFEVDSTLTLGLTKGDNSTKAGELPDNFRFLRSQYPNLLLEIPIDEVNARILSPLFSHSSILTNIAADFDIFIVPCILQQR